MRNESRSDTEQKQVQVHVYVHVYYTYVCTYVKYSITHTSEASVCKRKPESEQEQIH